MLEKSIKWNQSYFIWIKEFAMNSNEKILSKKIEDLEKELRKIKKQKKYGLVWEEKPEQIVEDCKRNVPILRLKEKQKGVEPVVITDETKTENILIEGDNYHALSVLNYTHKGKIDVIYIDPPYNTGNNDFSYNDKFVDKDDAFRHSKWTSFIEKRLLLSRDLLKKSGVFFVSIGDDEMAQLKLLCDGVFGEKNFLANIVRKSKETSNKGKYFSPSTDYILCYAKDIDELGEFNDAAAQTDDGYLKLFKYEDKRGKYNIVSLYMPSLDPRPNQRYFIECPDGSKVTTPEKDKMFRWIPSTFERNLKDDRVVFIQSKTSPLIDENGKQSKWNVYTKIYLHERQEKGLKPLTFIDLPNSLGSKVLIQMDIDFSFSKPKELVSHLLNITNKDKNILVLDFFAGSGTTGHSVLELNSLDGGNRNFILCTNNENGICENITFTRLNKVIKGYKSKKGEKVEGLGGNLRYYKTDLVDIEKLHHTPDQAKVKLTYQAGEMIGLRENTLNETEKNEWWQIFEGHGKSTAIYFKEDKEKLHDLVEKLEKKKQPAVLYIFSWGKNEYKSEYSSANVRVEDIPEPILEVYKEINRL